MICVDLPKTLHSPVMASIADSEFLDFSTLAIAIIYMYSMYLLLTLSVCAVGTIIIFIDTGHHLTSSLAG